MAKTQDIVQKLWNLCNVLRDDGITYLQYVTELTYLLFLKMAKETGTESQIPKGYRWTDLEKLEGAELLTFYKRLLIDLGSKGSGRVQAIYANASTSFRVVLPDNVLFEEGVGQKVRVDLMNKCDLHTILRLPTGIFYAQGVKTNVLFFTRGAKNQEKANTKAVWFFDMRTNMPSFGKRTPFTRAHFADFEKAFGADPHGKSKRKDQGEAGRFRKFTREEIAKRGDNLDITWLKDDSVTDHEDLDEPEVIAGQIAAQLRIALAEIDALQAELA